MKNLQVKNLKSSTMKKIAYGLGLLLCFFSILTYISSIKNGIYGMDEYRYLELAKMITRGDNLSQNFHIQKWPPGFPVLLLIVNIVFNNYFISAMVVTALSATLFLHSTIQVIYQITKKTNVTIIIGLHTFFSIIPSAIGTFVTDLPFAFCVQMMILYLYKGFELVYLKSQYLLQDSDTSQLKSDEHPIKISKKLSKIFSHDNRSFLIAGFFGGLSGLFRWTTMLLPPIAILLILIFSISYTRNLKDFSNFIIKLLKKPMIYCFFGCFFLVWSFWLIPNWIIFGSPFHNEVWWHPIIWGPMYIQEGNITLDQVNGLKDIIFLDLQLFIRNVIYVMGENIDNFTIFAFMGPSLRYQLGSSIANVVYMIVYGFVFIGIFSSIKGQNEQKFSNGEKKIKLIIYRNLLCLIGLFLLGNSISHTYARFIYAILPFGALYLIKGIQAVFSIFLPRIERELAQISTKNSKKYFKSIKTGGKIALFAIILISCLNTSKYYWYSYDRVNCHQIEMELIGDFFKNESNSTQICMSRTNYWFYINSSMLIWDMEKLDGSGNVYFSQYFGNTDLWYPRTPDQLKNLSYDYIIYCELRETNFSPQLRFLLDPDDSRIPDNFELVYFKTIVYETFRINNGRFMINENFAAQKDVAIYKIHH